VTFARLISLFAASAALILATGCTTAPGQDAHVEPISSADQTDGERRARIRLQLAVGYYQQGQLPIALEELRQALQSDPRLADAYSMRGLIFMEMGENRLAEDSFQQALKLAPNAPDYNNNYGWFLCQTGRERQSIGYFENAFRNRAYQSPGTAYNNAGVCSLKLNDVKAAHGYFMQAFQHDPGNASTGLNLARIYYERGDYERARLYVGRVMKDDIMTPEVLWLAVRVERKLGDRAAETSLATQLRRRHPASPEFAAYQRGAFDE
jgi:type IV pilus assembly protein PilF